MNDRHEFSAKEIISLLARLDERLRARGVSAAVFIVGGAAIAATSHRDLRRTEDIDAITRDQAVLDEARAIAREDGLPENWLNTRAAMWMPPLPPAALAHVPTPGLHVRYASDEFLLAMKLIAQRRRDADDIRELAARTGTTDATADELEALIYRHYTDPGMLEFIVGGTDVPGEIRLLAERAARMLTRSH
ncbi:MULTISPECIES: DUF6036 family nucleotidyltransferase [Protofrankia]|uniref:DUF6036 family nucleotidyltransferase n=1 Tax=Protofrankia TaxID=2994361 RepID=UPI00069C0D9D|nr:MULTISPECIES: DUF6036 family nucleotidyltransferase [Protofrankia]ONH38104.1 hypothetical protein BL254_01385 [Protofrankia sp. BMG5.30]